LCAENRREQVVLKHSNLYQIARRHIPAYRNRNVRKCRDGRLCPALCCQRSALSRRRVILADTFFTHFPIFFAEWFMKASDCSFPGVLNACLMWRAMRNDRVIVNWFHLVLYISSFFIS